MPETGPGLDIINKPNEKPLTPARPDNAVTEISPGPGSTEKKGGSPFALFARGENEALTHILAARAISTAQESGLFDSKPNDSTAPEGSQPVDTPAGTPGEKSDNTQVKTAEQVDTDEGGGLTTTQVDIVKTKVADFLTNHPYFRRTAAALGTATLCLMLSTEVMAKGAKKPGVFEELGPTLQRGIVDYFSTGRERRAYDSQAELNAEANKVIADINAAEQRGYAATSLEMQLDYNKRYYSGQALIDQNKATIRQFHDQQGNIGKSQADTKIGADAQAARTQIYNKQSEINRDRSTSRTVLDEASRITWDRILNGNHH